MYDAEISQSRKEEAARRQLGTALHLWLENLDPVSVHVLACGGCEVAETLARKISGKSFTSFSLEVHTELSQRDIVDRRNTFWNAMKHANDKKGKLRDDEDLLAEPLGKENEARLAEGWYDLMQVMPIPVEAHALVNWFFAKHADVEEPIDWVNELFPVRSMDEAEQKAFLLARIVQFRDDPELMDDDRIDRRPLIVPA